MKKKIIALCLILALAAIAVIGGTMAYFQDSDEDVNVFTYGNVDIEQYEHEFDDAGDFVELDADTAEEALKLMPVIHFGSGNYPNANPDSGTGEKFMIGSYYDNLDVEDGGVAAAERWAGAWTEPNVVDKYVSVTNTGANDCYVRTIIAYPKAMDDLICVNGISGKTWDLTSIDDSPVIVVDGIEYVIQVYTYIRGDGVLEPEKSTGPSLMQVLMMNDVDFEDIPAEFVDGFKILAVSQAVQTDGFAEAFAKNDMGYTYVADYALDAAFGEITADNNPWA
ncbi:MAG: hypothetical protein IJO64_06790 [Clostridia bacterium]|nr:hypothetical protein [Clostridia bacterium]MBQ9848746.1 hypothetical protein [Clostridia bacterium]